MRFFTTAGPIIPQDHYHVPPLQRLDRDAVLRLIQEKRYFVLHAPRQTGKTSALLALTDELNASGAYRCLYVNVESGQSAREDVAAAMRALLNELAGEARLVLDDPFPAEVWPEVLERAGPHNCLREVLSRWAAADRKPLVLLIDEIDALVDTHLDQLTDKLREARVRSVIEPLLSGIRDPGTIAEDDLQYVRDLGLVASDRPLRIANPIYREVIPRVLTYTTQELLYHDPAWYVDAAGNLLLADLLIAFQEFFREHSKHWVQRFEYQEAGPQLLLQAFLQRIVNSGGLIYREYGLGLMRTDLLIVWPAGAPPGRERKTVIECKVVHPKRSVEETVREGLKQTRAYLDRCAAAEGHLVVFDRRPDRTWEEKVFRHDAPPDGPLITVWGM